MDAPCTFGASIPFLQVAFGINMLFGAWDGIYDKLTESQNESRDSDDNLLSRVDADGRKREALDTLRATCQSVRSRFRRAGRIIGLTLATIVAVGLLFIERQTNIGSFGLFLVAMMGATAPIMMTIMVWVDRRYQKRIHEEANKIAREVSDAAASGIDGAIQVASSLGTARR